MSLRSLTKWQWTTAITLTGGYAGYYFCRSNFSVAMPLLEAEYGEQGLDMEALGMIASWSVLFYTVGKLFNGVMADFVTGKRVFLFGMLASICATMFFGLGTGFAVFLVATCLNRLVQSMGWVALVKTASRWFPPAVMGTMMGVLCLSFFAGDTLARLFLGKVIDLGFGWRGVYFAAAGVFGLIFLWCLVFLKSSPKDVGEEEPPASEHNIYGEAGQETRPTGLWDLLRPFIFSMPFWLICLVNFGLTIVRETFNTWTPMYLHKGVDMSAGSAAMWSSLFPLFGGISVVVAGFISDRVTKGNRGAVMCAFLLPGVVALFVLSQQTAPSSPVLPVALICLVGFLTLGPYAFLSGVISVDLGGKRGSATAAGLADTVGYTGGIVAGWGFGKVAQDYGWSTAFLTLAGILAVAAALSLVYWYVHEYQGKRVRVPRAEPAPSEG